MATVVEASERVDSVQIEGLSLLKIVKHCHDSLPHMVSGSLMGLVVEKGVLEITHAFPLPPENKHAADSDEDAAVLDGHEYQLEMMRLLREVNVDSNCVGWYQSMYLGIYSTSSLMENQFSYQTDLSPNAVVLLYDPMQTSHGNLVLKCYRLSEECIKVKEKGINSFIHPKNIFEEISVTITNPALVRALLTDIADGVHGSGENGLYDAQAETTFQRLDLSTNPYLEKHLEFLASWVDDLAAEQQKFQYYTRQLARGGGKDSRKDWKKKREEDLNEDGDGWGSSDAPRRMESLLISNQIRSYCDQMDKFTSGGLSKLYLAGGLHKDNK